MIMHNANNFIIGEEGVTMKATTFCLVMLTVLFCGNVLAQPQLWDVFSTSNQPFVNVAVDRYESDSLYLKSMNQVIALHQDSVKYMFQKRSSKAGLGFLIGAVAGGVAMNGISQSDGLFGDMFRVPSIAIGVAIGAGIGGAVGSSMGADRKYRMEKLSPEQKRELLSRLFPSVVAEK